METSSSPLSALAALGHSAFTQERRLFTLHLEEAGFDSELLPLSLQGYEQLSETYRIEVVCLSPDVRIELKRLIGLGADIAIRCQDDSERTVAGVVTAARQIGSEGGFTRYGLTIEPALATLRLRRNSRVFQDKSAVDIVRLLLDEHIASNPAFTRHFLHRSDLSRPYPQRSFCQQYRESDLAFITRLLREEGISYRFDFNRDTNAVGQHSLVLFDSDDTLTACPQPSLRFHRADATEADDTLTQWQAQRHIHSGGAQLASFDYKRVYTQTGSDHTAIDQGASGSALINALQDYDPQTLYYGADNSELNRYATLRQQAHDLQGKHFRGSGVVRALAVGHWFTLEEHPAHEGDSPADREFIVLQQRFRARNNLPDGLDRRVAAADKEEKETGYWHDFSAVRRSIPIVPPYSHTEHAKPTARGAQSATLVGPAGEEIFTDPQGRIKIQCHWARPQDHEVGKHGAGANRDDFSSCWVRVMMPSAGSGFGHQFIPRIGQEVLVDFIDGDIDRPVVVRTLHNGQQRPPTFSNAGALPANKTLSGIKSQELKGTGHNELIFDDSTGQLRSTLASTRGASQLHLGYLIHPRSNGKGNPRGEGFELRSDNAGAIRAAQGLLISTESQPGAGGHQLDRTGAQAQLQAAQNLAQQLGDNAAQHNASLAKPAPALTADPFADKQPHLLLSGHGGIAIATPRSAALVAGEDNIQIAQRDLHQSSGRRWIHNVGESISLFASGNAAKLKQAIKLIAGQGDLLMQAQSNDVELTADTGVTLTACHDKLTATAGKELLLQSGGGYIRISGGNIDIHCPGTLSMKAANFVHEAGTSVSINRPEMPSQDYGSITPVEPGVLDIPIVGDLLNGVLDGAALVNSVLREDGLAVQPFTGKVLSTPEVQDAKFGAITGIGGGISALGRAGTKVAKSVVPDSQVMQARQRQTLMLEKNIGFNISPTSWDNYPMIGRNGTFISDQQGITDIIGDLSGRSQLTLDKSKALQLEKAFGLENGTLQEGFKIRKVNNISDRMTRTPMEGNQYFLGPGNHLPGGAPEMVIDSIPTVDGDGVTTLLEVFVK